MRHLFGPLGLVGTFALGVAAGLWFTHGLVTVQEVARLRAVESRLQGRANTLEARLRPDGVLSPGNEEGPQAPSRMPGQDRSTRLAVAGARANASAYLGVPGPRDSSRIGTRQPHTSPASAGGSTTDHAPTASAALDRFYSYVDEMNAPGGLDRWQRMQQLVDELRKMGQGGAEVLLQVL